MHPVWADAATATALLRIDPIGLGGMVIRARAGPVRDALLAAIKENGPRQKLHPAMTSEVLEDGIDLSATLGAGTVIERQGLLTQHRHFLLTMAERCEAYLAARLAQVLDEGGSLVALDEGADPDESLPVGLADRMAFHICLDDLALADIVPFPDFVDCGNPSKVTCTPQIAEDLVQLASQLGIGSLRAPALALAAARTHAALNGRQGVQDEDVVRAVELVYAARATRLPTEAEPPAPEQESAEPPEDQKNSDGFSLPQEMLLEAVKAALPVDLLERLTTAKPVAAKGTGAGAKRSGNRRGRPLPARGDKAKSGARVDLMASLRAALPWQTLRKQQFPDRNGAIVLPQDLRGKRYQTQSDRLLIFTVDASGSAAMARLGEAKGAVEILLSQAYASRDHVALIAFRAEGAELLLPPTRSLVQTKRRLAQLPGGGGTPLAAGLQQAGLLAEQAAAKGLSPAIVLLTDGRGNIDLSGQPDRTQASADAQTVARALAGRAISKIVIDTGRRPTPDLRALSDLMQGHYLPLPRADAEGLARAVSQLDA